MAFSDAEAISERVNKLLPNVAAGTLTFFGQWFGRPMDNVHHIVACEAIGESVQLTFDAGETLVCQMPRGFIVSGNQFKIVSADRVRWEWFPYGLARAPENLRYLEYEQIGDHIMVSTNRESHIRTLEPIATVHAVEIH